MIFTCFFFWSVDIYHSLWASQNSFSVVVGFQLVHKTFCVKNGLMYGRESLAPVPHLSSLPPSPIVPSSFAPIVPSVPIVLSSFPNGPSFPPLSFLPYPLSLPCPLSPVLPFPAICLPNPPSILLPSLIPLTPSPSSLTGKGARLETECWPSCWPKWTVLKFLAMWSLWLLRTGLTW